MIARALVAAIRGYQTVVSPLLGQRCRFAPSCSEYSRESILRFGALYGSWLTVRRLARCQPFAAGGWDPVPQERHHKPGRPESAARPSTTTGATR
jgi:uncharacterized protein